MDMDQAMATSKEQSAEQQHSPNMSAAIPAENFANPCHNPSNHADGREKPYADDGGKQQISRQPAGTPFFENLSRKSRHGQSIYDTGPQMNRGIETLPPCRGIIQQAFTRVLIFLIRVYQITLSPFLGGHCRYEPTCSHYAIEAIQEYGPWRGGALALKRLLRCHPFVKGGYDPVPPRHSKKT